MIRDGFKPVGDPVVRRLPDQVNADEAHRGVDAAQDEEQIGNSVEDIGVSKVALIRPGFGDLKNNIKNLFRVKSFHFCSIQWPELKTFFA